MVKAGVGWLRQLAQASASRLTIGGQFSEIKPAAACRLSRPVDRRPKSAGFGGGQRTASVRTVYSAHRRTNGPVGSRRASKPKVLRDLILADRRGHEQQHEPDCIDRPRRGEGSVPMPWRCSVECVGRRHLYNDYVDLLRDAGFYEVSNSAAGARQPSVPCFHCRPRSPPRAAAATAASKAGGFQRAVVEVSAKYAHRWSRFMVGRAKLAEGDVITMPGGLKQD